MQLILKSPVDGSAEDVMLYSGTEMIFLFQDVFSLFVEPLISQKKLLVDSSILFSFANQSYENE